MKPAIVANPPPFARAKLGDFIQDKPQLHNPYTTDGPLKRYLQRLLPADVFQTVESDLCRFGERIVNEIDAIGRECELNQPYLQSFDAWGRRVDKLVTSSAWKRMKTIAAEEGLVATGYENVHGEYNRLYQFAKLYLYSPSGGLFTCPIGATDGAAKVIKEVNERLNDPNLTKALERLTSRNPDRFWTSGQWMTEKRGGSDVANATETVAHPLSSDGIFTLHGYKWFTSVTDADVSITLARPSTVPGTRGLSLFFVQIRNPDTNDLNNIEIVRLKDKLGTRQLPTSELLLDGTVAQKISEDGRGVASIASMLNITRIHNAMSGVGYMRRIISLSRDYMVRRKAFGKPLAEHPLHVQTVARLEVETRGNLALLLEIAKLLGLQEKKKATNDQILLLRLLTPLLKLYNGKMVVPLISEGLESFGGMGYLEDTGLPTMIRDAQILPIWEGTTNILSMDVLRHLKKEGDAVLRAYTKEIHKKIHGSLHQDTLKQSANILKNSTKILMEFASKNSANLEVAARDFAISLTRCYIGALLLEHALSNFATVDDVETAIRWCQQSYMIQLKSEDNYSSKCQDLEKIILFSDYPKSKL